MKSERTAPPEAPSRPPARIHPTAIVEEGAEIGSGTSIWDNAHVRAPCRIGRDCIIGGKSYIAYGVEIGDGVKINASVYICTAVTIEENVMVSAGVTFTNDRFPRAFDHRTMSPAPSEPNEETLATVVRSGATIGAAATIGPGIEIGRYAMIGMGSVVTKPVAAHALVHGNPARVHGWVCVCGNPLNIGADTAAGSECNVCSRNYRPLASGGLLEVA